MILILDYVYMRNVGINHENVCQLLELADFLIVPELVELCCDFLRSLLAPENCIGILRFASNYFCPSLESGAHCFLMRNFVQVSQQSDELLGLSPEELQAVISSDELNVMNEEVVWEVVLRWINHDMEERKGDIVGLMKKVRLGLLDPTFFLERVKVDPYVRGNCECDPIVTYAHKFLYDFKNITQKDREVLTQEFARPRIPHDILFVIGGWKGDNPTNCIETYDARAGQWVEVQEVDPAGPRAFHAMAVIGFNIYVVGGFNGEVYFNSCRCFNAVEKTWSEVSPMNIARCYVSVAVLDELVYAMGGYDGRSRHITAERYDYQRNQWSMIARMNYRRSDASAATLNGKIYIAGGYDGLECMNSAEVYDPEVNQWTCTGNMNFRRSGISCIAYHGHVYSIGGFDGTARMCNAEKYDPTTDTWTQIPDMRTPRSKSGTEVIDDMIFAIGGYNGSPNLYSVECYEEKSNEWFEGSNMNLYRSAVSACVIMGLPNVRDYVHRDRDRARKKRRVRGSRP
jgi:kelch-like protein 10